MNSKVSFKALDGTIISGWFEVNDGKVTVTAPDGRVITVGTEEAMLGAETLARMILFQMHQKDNGRTKHGGED
jgi:hypothetical protein